MERKQQGRTHMSKYTTELRYIIEDYNKDISSDNQTADDMIAKALPKLFNFSFPIYDESYRQTLEMNIVRHFYTREICCETVGRWKMFLRDRLNIIMPQYNTMYESLNDLQEKLFANVDVTETTETSGNSNTKNNSSSNSQSNNTSYANSTGNSNSNGNSTALGDAWQTSNDTPQGGLEGLETNRYLSSATHNKSKNDSTSNTSTENASNASQEGTSNTDSTSNSSSDTVSTQTYVRHLLGRNGGSDYINIYNKLVDSYLNIDKLIIDELENLFFGLW